MLSIQPVITGSDGNLYIINCNNNLYLLECGIDYKLIIKYLGIKNVLISSFKGCFLSHRHLDHTLAINEINRFMPIYSNMQVMEKYNFEGRVLNSKVAYSFDGNLTVMPFDVEHGSAQCYAYMFKENNTKILFITDCFKFDEPLNAEFDEIYIECNWTRDLMLESLKKTKDTPQYTKFERQYQTHMSLDALKLILEKSIKLNKCKKITLVHPSKDVCDKDLVLNELRNLYPNIDISFAENKIEGVTNGYKRLNRGGI